MTNKKLKRKPKIKKCKGEKKKEKHQSHPLFKNSRFIQNKRMGVIERTLLVVNSNKNQKINFEVFF